MLDMAVQPWGCAATLGDPLALGRVVELGNRPRSLEYPIVVEWEFRIGPGVAARLRNRARVVRGLGCGCDNR
jgi:hypothetical protein